MSKYCNSNIVLPLRFNPNQTNHNVSPEAAPNISTLQAAAHDIQQCCYLHTKKSAAEQQPLLYIFLYCHLGFSPFTDWKINFYCLHKCYGTFFFTFNKRFLGNLFWTSTLGEDGVCFNQESSTKSANSGVIGATQWQFKFAG